MEDFVGATKNLVFVTDNQGQLAVMASKDGAQIGSLPMKDFPVRYGNELTDRIYAATKTGLVVCIREQNKEFPSYHMFPERQPILPEFASDDEAAGDDNATGADDAASGSSF